MSSIGVVFENTTTEPLIEGVEYEKQYSINVVCTINEHNVQYILNGIDNQKVEIDESLLVHKEWVDEFIYIFHNSFKLRDENAWADEEENKRLRDAFEIKLQHANVKNLKRILAEYNKDQTFLTQEFEYKNEIKTTKTIDSYIEKLTQKFSDIKSFKEAVDAANLTGEINFPISVWNNISIKIIEQDVKVDLSKKKGKKVAEVDETKIGEQSTLF